MKTLQRDDTEHGIDYVLASEASEEIYKIKEILGNCIPAIESGIEYANECLQTHEQNNGRGTFKGQIAAYAMEDKIQIMENTLDTVRDVLKESAKRSRLPHVASD